MFPTSARALGSIASPEISRKPSLGSGDFQIPCPPGVTLLQETRAASYCAFGRGRTDIPSKGSAADRVPEGHFRAGAALGPGATSGPGAAARAVVGSPSGPSDPGAAGSLLAGPPVSRFDCFPISFPGISLTPFFYLEPRRRKKERKHANRPHPPRTRPTPEFAWASSLSPGMVGIGPSKLCGRRGAGLQVAQWNVAQFGAASPRAVSQHGFRAPAPSKRWQSSASQ